MKSIGGATVMKRSDLNMKAQFTTLEWSGADLLQLNLWQVAIWASFYMLYVSYNKLEGDKKSRVRMFWKKIKL